MSMSIYHVLIINRAGSLIYDYENKQNEPAFVEKTFGYPLGIALEVMDQKPTVIFGSQSNIHLRYTVVSVNGQRLKGQYFTPNEADSDVDFMTYIESDENFPMTLVFAPPILTANEKIVLSSMFHSLYTIAAQLSPVVRSSGIEVLETNQFRLHCFQSITGVKFLVVAARTFTQNLDALLRKIYELYADYALKNPFYSIDMPIRADKFEDALKILLEKYEKYSLVTLSLKMVLPIDLQFLSKIRDRLGYLMIQDGAIFKSEGELANDERISQLARKIVAAGDPNTMAGEKFTEISIHYPNHFYTVHLLEDGATILVVKRDKTPTAENSTMHLID